MNIKFCFSFCSWSSITTSGTTSTVASASSAQSSSDAGRIATAGESESCDLQGVKSYFEFVGWTRVFAV